MPERAAEPPVPFGLRIARLTDRVLLVAGDLPLPSSKAGRIELETSPDISHEAYWLPHRPAAKRRNAVTSTGLLVIRVERAVTDSLDVVSPARFRLVAPAGSSPQPTELRTLLENYADGLSERECADVQQFLLTSLLGESNVDRAVARGLQASRDILRRRFPTSAVDPARPLCLQIDALHGLDTRSFYIDGWTRSERGLEEFVLLAPEGWTVDLADHVYRYNRPDVKAFFGESGSASNEYGFIAYFELPGQTALATGWIAMVRDADGTEAEVAAPPVTSNEQLTRESIVGDVALESLPDDYLRLEHVSPAILRLQTRLAERTAIERIDQFGDAPPDLIASVVVPLYKRVDFLEQQLAQFVLDPEFLRTDLVYVLDSPEDAEYLRAFALQLHRLYRVPFRLATLNRNGGFAVANNLGATLARAPLLLLLNSDVIPEEPGWLSRLVSFYESTPGIGALSPKLLYEDDTLQFAGLYFDRPAGAHLWSNEHFYKGLHRDLPQANNARPVPAVTGACLMIAKDVYQELGGLQSVYVQGDYEDSDLCLRLAEAGYDNWYFPDVALYHLEGQSYPSELRKATSEYNKWLHTYRWRSQLEELSAPEVAV
jgi:GT2 family glycosyltransferase